MSITWGKNISQLFKILNELSVQDDNGNVLGHEEAFSLWKNMVLQIRSRGDTIYFVGNGASASMASHFAADMAKNCGVRTNVFTDPSLLTALANDICYEEVFAEPLRWYMREGDMMVAISSSGNSPNIVRAVETAKKITGNVITLSAMGENNKVQRLGDLNFYVPAKIYGFAETAHAAILHYWMDMVEQSIR
jgi:D-sedoheptulose 7-phosphate isomerase